VEPGFLDAYVPSDGIGMHTMRALLDSARVVPPGELHCSQVFLLVITDDQLFFSVTYVTGNVHLVIDLNSEVIESVAIIRI
jgi:hypothetical protein